MSKFKIVLTEHGVSILTQEQFYDADGNPVTLGNDHRTAIGLNDFATEQDFRDAIDTAVAGKFNNDLVTGLQNIKVAVDKTAALTIERDALLAERATIASERDVLKAERDSLLAENTALKAQNPANPGNPQN